MLFSFILKISMQKFSFVNFRRISGKSKAFSYTFQHFFNDATVLK